jgi:hypothetical protein
LFILAGAGIIALGFVSINKPVDKHKTTVTVKGPSNMSVILELFTSEGCSSCPPADRLLPELVKLDSNIIPLSFHVDYWNRLGWKDPFSSSVYTERQREYVSQLNLESAYTPQLVVNGEYEMTGSNRSDAETAIKKVLNEKPVVSLSITDVKTGINRIHFTVNSEGDFKNTLVQKKGTMKVTAGENSGTILSHINIVRSLSQQTTTVKNEFEVELPKNITADNWQMIIFTQQKNDLKITGAVVYNPG